MDLVVKYVHHPGGEEGHPPDDDHVGDLMSCHLVGISMDIYELHLFSYICKSGHCQSESNGSKSW